MKYFSALYKKCVAGGLCFIFVLTGQMPSGSAQVIRESSPQTAIEALHAEKISSVTIPEKWGEISDRYVAAGGRTVILIQDAHAVPDAQMNLHALIRYFEKKYGVKQIAVEGASSALDTQFFKSFPDQKILKTVLKEYYSRAELSGVGAAALFSGANVQFQGMEDWTLYETAIADYLDAVRQKDQLYGEFKNESAQLAHKKEAIYSSELFELDRLVEEFYSNISQLADLLKALVRIRLPSRESELEALANEIKKEVIQDVNPLNQDIEVREIAERVEKLLDSPKEIREFNAHKQDWMTGAISPEMFAASLQEMVREKGVELSMSRALSQKVEGHYRLKSIEGTRLLKELGIYINDVKNQLIQKLDDPQAALELDQKTERLRLLNKLMDLELSREGWDIVKGMDVPTGYAKHLAFYRNAEERERAFFSNVKKQGWFEPQENAAPIVFVAGGFHTQGMTQKLKAEGMSYVLVTPKINRLPDENFYRQHMAGDVSWKNYFKMEGGKIKPYDAFLRGLRDELLKQNMSPYILKLWRDQIIRDLAVKGQVQDAWRYTHFIDELLDEKPAEGKFERFSRRVDQFLSGLRFLNGQGKLNQASMVNLLNSMTAVDIWAGTAPWVPGAKAAFVRPVGVEKKDAKLLLDPQPLEVAKVSGIMRSVFAEDQEDRTLLISLGWDQGGAFGAVGVSPGENGKSLSHSGLFQMTERGADPFMSVTFTRIHNKFTFQVFPPHAAKPGSEQLDFYQEHLAESLALVIGWIEQAQNDLNLNSEFRIDFSLPKTWEQFADHFGDDIVGEGYLAERVKQGLDAVREARSEVRVSDSGGDLYEATVEEKILLIEQSKEWIRERTLSDSGERAQVVTGIHVIQSGVLRDLKLEYDELGQISRVEVEFKTAADPYLDFQLPDIEVSSGRFFRFEWKKGVPYFSVLENGKIHKFAGFDYVERHVNSQGILADEQKTYITPIALGDTPVYESDEHDDAYRWLESLVRQGIVNWEDISIWLEDPHHDNFGPRRGKPTGGMHLGNWIEYARDRGVRSIKWVYPERLSDPKHAQYLSGATKKDVILPQDMSDQRGDLVLDSDARVFLTIDFDFFSTLGYELEHTPSLGEIRETVKAMAENARLFPSTIGVNLNHSAFSTDDADGKRHQDNYTSRHWSQFVLNELVTALESVYGDVQLMKVKRDSKFQVQSLPMSGMPVSGQFKKGVYVPRISEDERLSRLKELVEKLRPLLREGFSAREFFSGQFLIPSRSGEKTEIKFDFVPDLDDLSHGFSYAIVYLPDENLGAQMSWNQRDEAGAIIMEMMELLRGDEMVFHYPVLESLNGRDVVADVSVTLDQAMIDLLQESGIQDPKITLFGRTANFFRTRSRLSDSNNTLGDVRYRVIELDEDQAVAMRKWELEDTAVVSKADLSLGGDVLNGLAEVIQDSDFFVLDASLMRGVFGVERVHVYDFIAQNMRAGAYLVVTGDKSFHLHRNDFPGEEDFDALNWSIPLRMEKGNSKVFELMTPPWPFYILKKKDVRSEAREEKEDDLEKEPTLLDIYSNVLRPDFLLEAYDAGYLHQMPVAEVLRKIGVEPDEFDAAIVRAGEAVIREELVEGKLHPFAEGSQSKVFSGMIHGNEIIIKQVNDEDAQRKYLEMQDVLGDEVAGYLPIRDLTINLSSGPVTIPFAVIQEKAETLADRILRIKREAESPEDALREINDILQGYVELFIRLLKLGFFSKPNGFLIDLGVAPDGRVVVIDVGDLLSIDEYRESYSRSSFLPTLSLTSIWRKYQKVDADDSGQSRWESFGVLIEPDEFLNYRHPEGGIIYLREHAKAKFGGAIDLTEYPAFQYAKEVLTHEGILALLSEHESKGEREIYRGGFELRKRVYDARLAYIRSIVDGAFEKIVSEGKVKRAEMRQSIDEALERIILEENQDNPRAAGWMLSIWRQASKKAVFNENQPQAYLNSVARQLNWAERLFSDVYDRYSVMEFLAGVHQFSKLMSGFMPLILMTVFFGPLIAFPVSFIFRYLGDMTLGLIDRLILAQLIYDSRSEVIDAAGTLDQAEPMPEELYEEINQTVVGIIQAGFSNKEDPLFKDLLGRWENVRNLTRFSSSNFNDWQIQLKKLYALRLAEKAAAWQNLGVLQQGVIFVSVGVFAFFWPDILELVRERSKLVWLLPAVPFLSFVWEPERFRFSRINKEAKDLGAIVNLIDASMSHSGPSFSPASLRSETRAPQAELIQQRREAELRAVENLYQEIDAERDADKKLKIYKRYIFSRSSELLGNEPQAPKTSFWVMTQEPWEGIKSEFRELIHVLRGGSLDEDARLRYSTHNILENLVGFIKTQDAVDGQHIFQGAPQKHQVERIVNKFFDDVEAAEVEKLSVLDRVLNLMSSFFIHALFFVFQLYTPFATYSDNDSGQIETIFYQPRVQLTWRTWVVVFLMQAGVILLGGMVFTAGALIAILGINFTAIVAAHFITKRFFRADGHELSHILQFIMAEKLSREILNSDNTRSELRKIDFQYLDEEKFPGSKIDALVLALQGVNLNWAGKDQSIKLEIQPQGFMEKTDHRASGGMRIQRLPGQFILIQPDSNSLDERVMRFLGKAPQHTSPQGKGALGWIRLAEVQIDGKLALYISEIQSTPGFHSLWNKKGQTGLSSRDLRWTAAVVREIVQTAKSLGYEMVAAKHPDVVRVDNPHKPQDKQPSAFISEESMTEHYRIPFRGWNVWSIGYPRDWTTRIWALSLKGQDARSEDRAVLRDGRLEITFPYGSPEKIILTKTGMIYSEYIIPAQPIQTIPQTRRATDLERDRVSSLMNGLSESLSPELKDFWRDIQIAWAKYPYQPVFVGEQRRSEMRRVFVPDSLLVSYAELFGVETEDNSRGQKEKAFARIKRIVLWALQREVKGTDIQDAMDDIRIRRERIRDLRLPDHALFGMDPDEEDFRQRFREWREGVRDRLDSVTASKHSLARLESALDFVDQTMRNTRGSDSRSPRMSDKQAAMVLDTVAAADLAVTVFELKHPRNRSESRFNPHDEDFNVWAQQTGDEYRKAVEVVWSKKNLSLQEASQEVASAADKALAAIHQKFREMFPDMPPIAFFKAGSYARGEMTQGSDLDGKILVANAKDLVDLEQIDGFFGAAFLKVLGEVQPWYIVDASRLENHEDFLFSTLVTELLEGRYVAGEKNIEEKMRENLLRRMADPKQRFKFASDTIDFWNKEFRSKLGSFLNLYERQPNIKNGAGGLREMNFALWIIQMMYGSPEAAMAATPEKLRYFLNEEEWQKAKRAHLFMLNVRRSLYAVQKKKNQKDLKLLSIEEQILIAEDFLARGLLDGAAGSTTLEKFLSLYRKHAKTLFFFNNKIVRRAMHEMGSITNYTRLAYPVQLNGEALSGVELVLRTGETVMMDSGVHPVNDEKTLTMEPNGVLIPAQIPKIFALAAREGYHITGELMDAIEQVMPNWVQLMEDENYRRSVQAVMLQILTPNGSDPQKNKIDYILMRMHALGIIEVIWPEYAGLQSRVIYDIKHKQTLDVYAIEGVTFLDRLLWSGADIGSLQKVSNEIKDAGLVRVLRAALFAQSLSEIEPEEAQNDGLSRAEALIESFQLDPDEKELVLWLVQSKDKLLDLMHFRGDVYFDGEEGFDEFRKTVLNNDPNRWNLLLLMTRVRLSFYSQERQEVYLHRLNHLLSIDSADFNAGSESQLKAKVESSREEIKAPAQAPDGKAVVVIQKIRKEVALLSSSGYAAEPEEQPREYIQLDVAVDSKLNQPGLLEVLASVLRKHRLSVHMLSIGEVKDGWLIDRFVVTRNYFEPVSQDDAQILAQKIQDDINRLLDQLGEEGADWDVILENYLGSMFNARKEKALIPIKTEVKIRSAQKSSFLILKTANRIGILRHVASVLRHHGINILNRTTIDTDGYDKNVGLMAVDSFEIQKNGKSLKPDEIAALISDLEYLFDQEEITPATFQFIERMKFYRAFRAWKQDFQKNAGAIGQIRLFPGKRTLYFDHRFASLTSFLDVFEEEFDEALSASGLKPEYQKLKEDILKFQETTENIFGPNAPVSASNFYILPAIGEPPVSGEKSLPLWHAAIRDLIQVVGYITEQSLIEYQQDKKQTFLVFEQGHLAEPFMSIAMETDALERGKHGNQMMTLVVREGSGSELTVQEHFEALLTFLEDWRAGYRLGQVEGYQIGVSFTASLRSAIDGEGTEYMIPASRVLMEVLNLDIPVHELMRALFEAGFLDLISGDFKKLQSHFDSKSPHQYFTAAHLLNVVEICSRLAYANSDVLKDGLSKEILQTYQRAYRLIAEKRDPSILSLFWFGTTMHDLGKAVETQGFGPSHMMLGAKVSVPEVLRSLAIEDPEKIAEWIAWHHQHLNAAMRDLKKGRKTVNQVMLEFASRPGMDQLRWNMLFLLSIADYLGVYQHFDMEPEALLLNLRNYGGDSGSETGLMAPAIRLGVAQGQEVGENQALMLLLKVFDGVDEHFSSKESGGEGMTANWAASAKRDDEAFRQALRQRGVAEEVVKGFPAWYLRLLDGTKIEQTTDHISFLNQFYHDLKARQQGDLSPSVRVDIVNANDHRFLDFWIGFPKNQSMLLARKTAAFLGNGLNIHDAVVQTLEGGIAFNHFRVYSINQNQESEHQSQNIVEKYHDAVEADLREAMSQSPANLRQWYREYYQRKGITSFDAFYSSGEAYQAGYVEMEFEDLENQTALRFKTRDRNGGLHVLARLASEGFEWDFDESPQIHNFPNHIEDEIVISSQGGKISDIEKELFEKHFKRLFSRGRIPVSLLEKTIDDVLVARGRSEVRSEKLSERERQLIRTTLSNGMKREDGADIWVFGEQETQIPFAAGVGLVESEAPIPSEWFVDKKVLVAPGYGNLPFLIRKLGAEHVTAIDKDPATVAWQKLRYAMPQSGLDSMLLQVFDNSRGIAKMHWRDEIYSSLDADIPSDQRQSGMSFSVADLLSPIPQDQKYDLIVVPYVFAVQNGIESEDEWNLVLKNLTDALSEGGRIVIMPAKIDQSLAEDSPRKTTIQAFQNWIDSLGQRGFKVELSEAYPHLSVYSMTAVNAQYAVIQTARSEFRALPAVAVDRESVQSLLESFLSEVLTFEAETAYEQAQTILADIESLGFEAYADLIEQLRDTILADLSQDEEIKMNNLIGLVSAVLRQAGKTEIEVGLDDPEFIVMLENVLSELPLPENIRWQVPTTMREFKTSVGVVDRVASLSSFGRRGGSDSTLMTVAGARGGMASRVNAKVIDVTAKKEAPSLGDLAQARADVLSRLMVAVLFAGKVKDRKLLETPQGRAEILSSLGYLGDMNIISALEFDQGELRVSVNALMRLAQEFAARAEIRKSA